MASDTTDYQCVLVGDVWHLTQEQAVAPNVLRDGAWTSCAVWATFKRGFNRRRPDCPDCLNHVLKWESCRAPRPALVSEPVAETSSPVPVEITPDLIEPVVATEQPTEQPTEAGTGLEALLHID